MANLTVKLKGQRGLYEVIPNPSPTSPQDTKRLQEITEAQLGGRTPIELDPGSIGIDPRTGLQKLQATEGLSGIQNLTPLPLAASNAPDATASIPGAIPSDVFSSASISQGSEPIRGEIEDFRRTTQNLDQMLNEPSIQGFLGSQTFGETPEGAQELADIRKMAKQVGTLTPEQLMTIETSGVAAGESIAPAIRGAEEEKRQGLPRALIEAGERGGFMNTQFAGLAALTPTVGGTFFGAGGQLERIKSVYDRNIADLRTQQVLATQQAREAARRAELTRNKEDFERSAQLFQLASDSRNKAVELAAEKARFGLDVQRLEEQRRSREFQEGLETSREQRGIQAQRFEQDLAGRGEARTAAGFQAEQEERKKQQQLEEEKETLNRLQQISSVGGEITQSDRQIIDKKYGVGFTDLYIQADQGARIAVNEKEQLNASLDILKVLTNIPQDQTIQLGNAIYSGFKSVDETKGLYVTTEEDNRGNVTQVTTRFNPETKRMEIISTLPL